MTDSLEKSGRTCPRCNNEFEAVRSYCICPSCGLKFTAGDRWPSLPPLPDSVSFHASVVIAEYGKVRGEDVVDVQFENGDSHQLRFFEITSDREQKLIAKSDDWEDVTLPDSNVFLLFGEHRCRGLINEQLQVKLYNGKAIFRFGLPLMNPEAPFSNGPEEIIVRFDVLSSFDQFGLLADDCFRKSGRYKRYKRLPND